MFVFQTIPLQKSRAPAFGEMQPVTHTLTPMERSKLASGVEFMLQKINP